MSSHSQFDPFVEEPSIVELAEKAGLSDCVGRIAHLSATASYVAKVIVPLLAQDGRSPHQGNGFLVLRARVFQVPKKMQTLHSMYTCTIYFVIVLPEFDVPITSGDEVVSVLCEGDGLDLRADLVGGHLDVVPPVPHVHDHVVLGAN